MNFMLVSETYPTPHRRYLVKRGYYHFVATPCYGMHDPWWNPMGPDGEDNTGNSLIIIEKTDKYIEIPRE